MGHRVSRSVIAFGAKEPFTQPPPAGFVSERESFGAAETKTSPAIRVDHSEYFSISVAHFNTAADFDLQYETLVSSDGIDSVTGEYRNAVWSNPVTVVTSETSTRYHDAIEPPVTEAIRLVVTNNGGPIVAAPREPGDPGSGVGVQVRFHIWS